MQLSPIALFVYNRLAHTRQAVASLQDNYLSAESELFIFSDAPKNKETEYEVKKVREYLRSISGFKKVVIREQENNLGPSRSIIEGVSEIINKYGKVIVLEDDLYFSRYFLSFMNDALLFYENDPRVISISGYMYPIKTGGSETLFLRMTESWGWATWKRAWDLFEPDAHQLLKQLKARKLIGKFNLNGGFNYFKMLKKQAKKKISSWAICWYASSLLNNKLSLFPGRSLVGNLGFGESGTHCAYDAGYGVDIYQKRVVLSGIPVKEDSDVIGKIERFLRAKKFKKLGYMFRKFISILIEK